MLEKRVLLIGKICLIGAMLYKDLYVIIKEMSMSTSKRKRQQALTRASEQIAKHSSNDGTDDDTNKHRRLQATINKKVS